ncbi:MAG: MarR family transcriptional regulator [Candidatus Lokiarchaeota archaeon]|nr:MarR family transcriptional regulator [Candidatus Lokiarchaeota archaeon]MCK4480445.1 MarR family transcriptional regulator [Candidatus Lokiarchaeota archaeon]
MEVIEKQLKEFELIDGLLEKKEIFSSERLFKCILGLNKTESKILGYMLKNKDVRTSEIADVLHMDRSSIQRAVQGLYELKLIDRKSMSMKDYTNAKGLKDAKKQGYLYVYNAKNMESIKIQFKKLLDKWYNSMLKYIENLENLCECCGFKFEPC